MGTICSCFKQNKKEFNEHLIRDRYCHKCRQTYLSNYEYNRHIVNCQKIYGDI